MDFTPKRVVTGHAADGTAIIVTKNAPPMIRTFESVPDLRFCEIWNTSATPAVIDNGPDPTLLSMSLQPPPGGSICRVLHIPPESSETLGKSSEDSKRHFEEIGSREASTGGGTAAHPFMHRTETVDYGIVIQGTLTLVLDQGEVELNPGDVVVQRGTNHAWSNRSGAPVIIAFVLLDGRYSPEIADALAQRSIGV